MHASLPTRADLRRLAALAVPVTLVQLGMMTMGVVDTMVVGHYSPTALAGVAVGAVYAYAIGSFGMGVLLGLDPIVSQAVGAGDDAAVARGFQRGLVLAGALGVLAYLVLLPAAGVLRALGQAPEVVAVAAPFVRVQAPSLVGFFLFVALRVTLQAQGHMRPIVITIVAANLLNAALDLVLVYGLAGAPRLGAVGAGIASAIARVVMALLLAGLAWPRLRPWMGRHPGVLRAAPFSRLLQIGLPIGIQYELEYGAFAAVALVMGRLGTTALDAHQIAINIASLTFMVPLGVSSAGAVLVGRAVGAGDPAGARRAAVAALAAGGAFMAVSACVLRFAPAVLARAYTGDAAVIALACTLIPIAGVFQVFDGIQVVSIGVLRGAGDTRTPLFVNLAGYWLFALPLGLWLGFGRRLGPAGLWWGLVAGLVAVALVLLARVRVRLGQRLERLQIEGPAAPPAAPAA